MTNLVSSCAVRVHFGDRHLSKQPQSQEYSNDRSAFQLITQWQSGKQFVWNFYHKDVFIGCSSCYEMWSDHYFSMKSMQSVVVNCAIENKPTLTDKIHLNVILNNKWHHSQCYHSTTITMQHFLKFSCTSLCSHNVAYIKSALACCKVSYVELSNTITFDEVSVLRGQY